MIHFATENQQSQQVIEANQARLRGSYKVLEAALEGRNFLVGDTITHADMTCCGYLYYPESFGFNKSEWPNINRWLNNISLTAGWKAPYDLMPGSPADRA